MGKERILIFDECQANIEILKGILSEFDFKVLSTNKKDCFLELIKENNIDLIFYDVKFDALNELKTLKKLAGEKQGTSALIILMLSDKTQNLDANFLARNVIAIIQKPFNIELIKTIIRTFICLSVTKENAIKDLYDSLACFVHDLKTPLVARDYASKMLLDDSSLLSKSQKEVIEELHLSTKYLLALTNNFLAKYKYENSKIVLSKSLRDIVLDLHEVLFEIKYYAKSRACNIVLDIQEECFARYDEIGIKRIFYNLLINAIKYSPKNSEIRVNLKEKAGKVHLIVENLADGIDKAKFKNIFKKFVSSRNTCAEAGCGIGLAICREIAKMHGGNIKAKMEKVSHKKDGKLYKITFEMVIPNTKTRACSAKHSHNLNS